MNHRGAQINDVLAYAHTFSLYSDFFLCFVWFFCARAFYIRFSKK
jgi:hypothetical protein